LQSRNAFGNSLGYSDAVAILSASEPGVPTNVVTETVSPSSIVVRWSAAPNNGLDILEYKVYFMQRDYLYSLETSYCDGSDPAIIDATECTVPFDTLKAAPFYLVPGEWVNVKITAVNAYGESAFSDVGTGG
jgi:hypothetical protein